MLGVLLLLLVQSSPEKPDEQSQPPLADPAAEAIAAALAPPAAEVSMWLGYIGTGFVVFRSMLCCLCQSVSCPPLFAAVVVIDRPGTDKGQARLGHCHCCNVQVPGDIQVA